MQFQNEARFLAGDKECSARRGCRQSGQSATKRICKKKPAGKAGYATADRRECRSDFNLASHFWSASRFSSM
jgi:hypothetical protein